MQTCCVLPREDSTNTIGTNQTQSNSKTLYAFFLRENNYILISICQVRLIQKDGLPGKVYLQDLYEENEDGVSVE